MPISFQISTDLDLVYARWSGRVTFDDILWNFETYLSDAAYRPGRPELIDATEIEEVDVDFDRARAILRFVNQQIPGVAVATHTVLLAPGDTVRFQETDLSSALDLLRRVEAAVDWVRGNFSD